MVKKHKNPAGIVQTGTNAWRIRYVKDGNRYSHTIRGSRTDAIAERDKLKVQRDEGAWTAPATITFEEWATRWAEHHLKRHVSTRSYERQNSILKRHLVPVLGPTRIQRLAATRINELYADMEKDGLSAASVRYAHVVLGSCLKQAVREGVLARNPVGNASPPRSSTQSGGQTLSQPELARLVRAFEGDPHFVLVAMAAGTGARINELLALEWAAIDWASKTLRIDSALKPTKAGLERGVPKTERSRRTIRLDDGLIALLKAERDRQEAEQRQLRGIGPEVVMLRGLVEDALLFPRSPLNPAEPRRHGPISKLFSARAASLGLKKRFRFHDLRHCHTSLLLQAGVPVAAVSARLGHANAAVTLGIYSHSTTDAEAAAAQVAGSLLSGVFGRR
jgi:integrase